ncbi:hypothetical protein Tco_0574075, partial [Tanacetum coccineum]
AEAIHLILTGIGHDIYPTVDACTTTKEMWTAIERLQQGESLNKQDVKTNLFWEFGKFTSRDEESIESYYSRLKSYANPLALVATTQHYPEYHNKAPKPHKSIAYSSKQSTTSKSHASNKHKDKEIAKQITPPSESASNEDSDPEQAQRDKQLQKNLALVAKYIKNIYSKPTNNNFKTSSNTRNKNIDTTSRSGNDRNARQFVNQRTLTVAGAREIVGNQEEPDEQELEAHYLFMARIQEVSIVESGSTFDTEPLEKVDSNTTPDSSDVCINDFEDDQNDDDQEYERVPLANLITNLKLDTDDNKRFKSN